MSELVLSLLRLGYLAGLWLLVLAAIGVLRADVFGTRVVPRGAGRTATGRSGRSARPGSRPSGSRAPAARPAGAPPNPRGAVRPTGPSKLVVIDGALAGTTIPLASSSILAGRDPACTLVLDDDYASSRHARFFPQGPRWFVEDLGSTNGTTVGGTRVGGAPMEVPIGTPVQVGRTVVELRR